MFPGNNPALALVKIEPTRNKSKCASFQFRELARDLRECRQGHGWRTVATWRPPGGHRSPRSSGELLSEVGVRVSVRGRCREAGDSGPVILAKLLPALVGISYR